jgi:hypothetical protein
MNKYLLLPITIIIFSGVCLFIFKFRNFLFINNLRKKGLYDISNDTLIRKTIMDVLYKDSDSAIKTLSLLSYDIFTIREIMQIYHRKYSQNALETLLKGLLIQNNVKG